MKIFNYNSDTKEFLGESDANLDPLETQNQGKPVYLLPAHATFTAPTVGPDKGQLLIYDEAADVWVVNDSLVLEPDYEQMIMSKARDIIESQAQKELKDAGEIPTDFDLAEYRAKKNGSNI